MKYLIRLPWNLSYSISFIFLNKITFEQKSIISTLFLQLRVAKALESYILFYSLRLNSKIVTFYLQDNN